MTWQADTVQFVIFTGAGTVKSADELWRSIANTPPLSFQQTPGMPSISNASGKVGAFGAVLQLQPGRAEIILTPAPDQSPAISPVIEDAADALNAGIPLARSLTAALQGVTRLAIVVDANRPAANAVDASASVKALIGFSLPDGVSDLSLQFNRRRSLSIGHDINRLCRWQTTTKQLFQFTAPAGGMFPAPTVAREEHFTGLLIDVNTVPGAEIEPDAGNAIFGELADEVRLLLDDAYARLTH